MADTQQETDIKVPHLKSDAILEVKLGTAFINRLQQMFHYLVNGHDEELKKLEEKKGNYEDINSWENAVISTTMLLQEVMKVAQETNQIEFRSLKEDLEKVITTPNNLQ